MSSRVFPTGRRPRRCGRSRPARPRWKSRCPRARPPAPLRRSPMNGSRPPAPGRRRSPVAEGCRPPAWTGRRCRIPEPRAGSCPAPSVRRPAPGGRGESHRVPGMCAKPYSPMLRTSNAGADDSMWARSAAASIRVAWSRAFSKPKTAGSGTPSSSAWPALAHSRTPPSRIATLRKPRFRSREAAHTGRRSSSETTNTGAARTARKFSWASAICPSGSETEPGRWPVSYSSGRRTSSR